ALRSSTTGHERTTAKAVGSEYPKGRDRRSEELSDQHARQGVHAPGTWQGVAVPGHVVYRPQRRHTPEMSDISGGSGYGGGPGGMGPGAPPPPGGFTPPPGSPPGGFTPPPGGAPPGGAPPGGAPPPWFGPAGPGAGGPGGPAREWQPMAAMSYGWDTVLRDYANIGRPIAAATLVSAIVNSIFSGMQQAVEGEALAYVVAPVSYVVNLVVNAFILGGVFHFSLGVLRGRAPAFNEVFSGGRFFGPMLLAHFLYSIAVTIGVIACIVPGVVVALGAGF